MNYNNLNNMLEVRNIFPSCEFTNQNVFDFAEEGTVGRALFEDNIELLQQLLAVHPDEGKNIEFNTTGFIPSYDGLYEISTFNYNNTLRSFLFME